MSAGKPRVAAIASLPVVIVAVLAIVATAGLVGAMLRSLTIWQ